jgi:hypothetical protein
VVLASDGPSVCALQHGDRLAVYLVWREAYLPGRNMNASQRIARRVLLALGLPTLLGACANQQIQAQTQQSIPTTQVLVVALQRDDLRAGGIAFITPSSITGQEEDKQALAMSFTEVLLQRRPDLGVMSLSQTLSAINRQGLTREYRQMFEDYRLTGIFDRETLEKVAKVTKTRYLAQLKLGAFRQEPKSRFGFLGLRVLETKTSTIRLFLQIWDSQDGSVAWEGAQESTVSHESIAEEYVSMKDIVQESARDLVGHLP